jgi:tellurite resistance protein
MVAADGKVTTTERDAWRGAIRGLAGDVLHDGTIQVMLEQYERSLAGEGREARLRALGATLSEIPAAAEGAFALAAAVALADDEVADEERALVEQIRDWFGITADRASVILHQLDDDKA